MTRLRTPRCSTWHSAQRVSASSLRGTPTSASCSRWLPTVCVAGQARLVGHARERGAVAGRAVDREEAMRVRDVAGVPRHADIIGGAGRRHRAGRGHHMAEGIERDRQRRGRRRRRAGTAPMTRRACSSPGRGRCGSAPSAARARRPAAAPARPSPPRRSLPCGSAMAISYGPSRISSPGLSGAS